MAIHSSILAWKIPWTEEPGGPQSMGSQRVGHDRATNTDGVSSNSCTTESVMPSKHLILYYPLLLLPSTFPSITVFSRESALCIKWPKYWSFSFIISELPIKSDQNFHLIHTYFSVFPTEASQYKYKYTYHPLDCLLSLQSILFLQQN